MTGLPPDVTVESVQAQLRLRNDGENLPTCPACQSSPVRVELTELPSSTPTGRSTQFLGRVMHLRPAVVVGCGDPENCTWIGIEVTGLTPPEGKDYFVDGVPVTSIVGALHMTASSGETSPDAKDRS